MKYYLCTFDDDVEATGFRVVSEEEKDSMLRGIRNEYEDGGEIEGMFYDDADEVIETLSFKIISKAEYRMIERLFGGSFGEQGPMDEFDEEDEEEEERYCEECGTELEDHESDICDSCNEEWDEEEDEDEEENRERTYTNTTNMYYKERIDSVVNCIKKEFSLELDSNSNYAAYFKWMPTPKAELTISIDKFVMRKDHYIEMILKHNNKVIVKQKLLFDDWNRRQQRLKIEIQELVNKANHLFNH